MANSAMRLIAPIRLAGSTALSVEIITIWSQPNLCAVSASRTVPNELTLIHYFKRMAFHQRYVLECRCMEDNAGSMLLKNLNEGCGITDAGADSYALGRRPVSPSA